MYHASSPTGERAIKVYKTSILVFKDRDRSVRCGCSADVAHASRAAQLCERRVSLPPRLLQEQPAQNGQSLGRKGDAQPQAVRALAVISACFLTRPARLCSLESAGIPCPKPLFLRNHVLMMSFIGEDGWCDRSGNTILARVALIC